MSIVVTTCLTGCRSAPAIRMSDVAASGLTGPALAIADQEIDTYRHQDAPPLELPLSKQWLAAPVTLDSLVPQHRRSLTLDQAIDLAFANSQTLRSLSARVVSNPASVAVTEDTAIQATDPVFGIDAALAQFDANLSASLLHANNDDVFNNSILGGGATEVVQDLTTANLAINKTNVYGTRFDYRANLRYDNNDNVSSTFPSSYATFWEATVRQPLLQGRGRQFNEIAGPNAVAGFRTTTGIHLSRINNKISVAQFESDTIAFLNEVIDAYWDLYFAWRNFDTSRTARDASLETWNAVKARYENDLPGGEADKEAQAREQYYQFQEQTLLAFNGDRRSNQTGVLQSEANLRRLIGMPQSDGTLIVASEDVFMGDIAWQWEQLVQEAMNDRVEMRQQRWRLKQRELELIASRNFMMPNFDAVATFRNNGFGDRLTGGDTRFSSALNDATSGDHNEWELGVLFDMPIGYRQAYAGVRNARLKVIREKRILTEQQKQIAHELGSALRDSRQAFQTLGLAQKRMVAAQDAYKARLAAFDADATNVDLLLESVQRMADAQSRFDSAQVNLQLARESIFLQSGQSLQQHAIRIADVTLE